MSPFTRSFFLGAIAISLAGCAATGICVTPDVPLADGAPQSLSEAIKASKLKVQAQYQDEQIRVSAKSKDDLQKVIQLLKELNFELPLQFVNYR